MAIVAVVDFDVDLVILAGNVDATALVHRPDEEVVVPAQDLALGRKIVRKRRRRAEADDVLRYGRQDRGLAQLKPIVYPRKGGGMRAAPTLSPRYVLLKTRRRAIY